MGKNVAVFVDVANIFYAAKAAGVDIDYVTLLKAASAGRDLVRAYAYTGLDPENENQRNFHSFLSRNGYKVVSKDIRKYGDGKVKANLDIELVVDMMKTARNLDIAIVVSGDGDFAPAIRAVQETGVRVEVISFRGNTSSDLIDVADQFTDITALAKVEKGSSRSGRRVAGDEEDLSMTEVPDKQTEGAGTRVRGRGRGRGRTPDAAVVRAGRGEGAAAETEPAAVTSSGAPLVVLPGERLSRAVTPTQAEEEEVEAVAPSLNGQSVGDEGEGEGDGRRRRRRRGGRGRGRGRGRDEIGPETAARHAEEEEEYIEPRPTFRPTPFGSVWDRQLGVPPQRPASPSTPPPDLDEEDIEEPEIPEYLIAEQRRNRGRGGRPQGGRGARGAYAAAMERERFGRGGGSGINRYPDVSGRERQRDAGFQRQDRGPRPDRGRPERGERRPGGEPWSEVPPELEAMLRAQLSSGRPRAEASPERRADRRVSSAPAVESPEADEVATAGVVDAAAEAAKAPRRRTTRRTTSKAAAAESVEAPPADAVEPAAEPAPKRRTTRRSSTAKASSAAEAAAETESATPKRRTTRRTTATTAESAEGEAPRRRTTRRKATEPAAEADAPTE